VKVDEICLRTRVDFTQIQMMLMLLHIDEAADVDTATYISRYVVHFPPETNTMPDFGSNDIT